MKWKEFKEAMEAANVTDTTMIREINLHGYPAAEEMTVSFTPDGTAIIVYVWEADEDI